MRHSHHLSPPNLHSRLRSSSRTSPPPDRLYIHSFPFAIHCVSLERPLTSCSTRVALSSERISPFSAYTSWRRPYPLHKQTHPLRTTTAFRGTGKKKKIKSQEISVSKSGHKFLQMAKQKYRSMSSPLKPRPEAVADKVLKRVEVSKVSQQHLFFPCSGHPALGDHD